MKKFKKKEITRSKRITLRFTEAEYENIVQKAKTSSMPVSDLIRRSALSKPSKGNNIVLISLLSEISRSLKDIVQKDETIDKNELKMVMDKLGQLLIKIPLFVGTR